MKCKASVLKASLKFILMAFIRNFLQLNTRNYNPVYLCFSYLQCFLYLDRCLKCFNVVNYSFLQNQQKITDITFHRNLYAILGWFRRDVLPEAAPASESYQLFIHREISRREREGEYFGLQTWSKNPWKQQVCPWPACVLRLLVC